MALYQFMTSFTPNCCMKKMPSGRFAPLNTLLLNCMFASGQLKEGEMYDVDFDHQFIETEKYDGSVSGLNTS